MSRWHVIESDPVVLSIKIAHACPGAHSPWVETRTWEFLEGAFRRIGSDFQSPIGEKPTYACRACAAMGRDHRPHLPWSGDASRDLERYGMNPTRFADEMYERWRVTA